MTAGWFQKYNDRCVVFVSQQVAVLCSCLTCSCWTMTPWWHRKFCSLCPASAACQYSTCTLCLGPPVTCKHGWHHCRSCAAWACTVSLRISSDSPLIPRWLVTVLFHCVKPPHRTDSEPQIWNIKVWNREKIQQTTVSKTSFTAADYRLQLIPSSQIKARTLSLQLTKKNRSHLKQAAAGGRHPQRRRWEGRQEIGSGSEVCAGSGIRLTTFRIKRVLQERNGLVCSKEPEGLRVG